MLDRRSWAGLIALACAIGPGATGCADPCFDDGLAQGGCPERSTQDAGEPTDAGTATQGGNDASAGTVDDTGVPTGGGDAAECPELEEVLLPQVPTFQLVVDQSGSMMEDFGGISRWAAMQNTLVGNDGIVTRLQSSIRFGISLYRNDGSGACPDVASLGPQLDAADEITTLLDSEAPGGDTPTGESIEVVTGELEADMWNGDKVLVLVTDGEPDTCAVPEPMNGTEIQESRDAAVNAVQAAYGANIRTFVIGVSTGIAEDHLQDLANAGVGVPAGDPDAPFWVANDTAALVDAFDDIISGLRPCTFPLSAPLVDELVPGCEVTINDAAVPYQDPDGWSLDDAQTLRLDGGSCDTIQEGVVSIRLTCSCSS